MSGESKVISGGKTKMHVYMSNMMTDEAIADKMRKNMKPSEKEGGRTVPSHAISKEEHEKIDQITGKQAGDL